MKRCLMTQKNNKNTNQSNTKKIILFGGLGIFTPIFVAYLVFSIYFSSHFYPNTKINGVKTTNMTVKEAEEAINAEVKSYVLTLEERNKIKEEIKGTDIDLHTEFGQDVKNILEQQKPFTWPIALQKNYTYKVNALLKYDTALLKEQINKLNCFKEAKIEEPENAYISDYNNGYKIMKEVQGTKVIKNQLYTVTKKAIIILKPTLSLEKEDCYEKPQLNSKNSDMVKALDQLNKIAGAKITYEFGDVTEFLDGDKISNWLTVDDNFEVSFDENGVKEYVDYIGKSYNSFGRIRNFSTSYGKAIKLKGGDYGWWLNRVTEVEELTKLVLNGEKTQRKPVYYQTAQKYGQDDIGNTYVEVNLTAQHLFYYKDGSLVLESDFVSGNVSKKFGTPTGTYPVQYKERNATLNGEDYSTPVNYWMPFNRNIGFHDASWRKEFGKDIYLTNGSHGCINMPPAKAKKLYENITKGTAVVVYKLKGTESYEVEKGNDSTNSSTDKNKNGAATNKTTTN